jgi:hypothetical protein
MRHLLLALVAGCLLASPVFPQQRVDLSINEARVVASRALLGGEPQVALTLAEAILQALPDDRGALVIVAAAAPRVGDPARGYAAGARAWQLSETPEQRYEAARLTALAANNQERFTTASLWLRLALISAPNETERDRTLQDARLVTQRNPWSTQLSFALAPSNNVNGGAEDEISSAPGNPDGLLSEDAQNLAGWRGSVGVTTAYRIHVSEVSRTNVGVGFQIGRVWITEETDVPNEAFDTSSARLFLRHDRALWGGAVGLGLNYGRYNYRDLDLSEGTTEGRSYDVAGVSAEYRYAVDDSTSLQLSLSRDLITYEETGIGEVDRRRVAAAVGYALASGDTVTASYSVTDSIGENDNYTSLEHGFRLGYRWAEPVGPVSLAVGAGIRWIDYPSYRLLLPVTGGRQDETISANLLIGFPDAEFAGFVPGLRIEAQRTDSNVSRFDSTTLGASLTIGSSF